MTRPAACRLDADLIRALYEERANPRVPDCRDGSSQHAYSVAFEYSRVVQRQAAVERRLPPERKKNRVDLFLGNYALDEIGIDVNEVDAIGEIFARLNRRDVWIDQNRRDAFFAQCLE